ncbi:MAG: diguanylate cyclase domain-containing protein [Burkholderiales bacterium]
MKTRSNAVLPKGVEPARSLTEVLEQSEHVKDLLEACAEELSSLNVLLERDRADRDPRAGIENVLEKSTAAQNKMQEASEKLLVVNRALEAEIRGRVMVDHQLAAAIEQEQAGRHAAFHDVLTGLPNRALFNNRLEHGFAQARRHGWTLAVMFVDLDDFKILNDSYGHDTGDVVLQTIARRLEENIRGADTVSRHGGDEFLYLLTEIRDEQSIAMIAEKIIQAIQAPCNISVRDLNIRASIRASIGISIFPKDGTTADALVTSADAAMYRAKEAKSGYSFAG